MWTVWPWASPGGVILNVSEGTRGGKDMDDAFDKKHEGDEVGEGKQIKVTEETESIITP